MKLCAESVRGVVRSYDTVEVDGKTMYKYGIFLSLLTEEPIPEATRGPEVCHVGMNGTGALTRAINEVVEARVHPEGGSAHPLVILQTCGNWDVESMERPQPPDSPDQRRKQ